MTTSTRVAAAAASALLLLSLSTYAAPSKSGAKWRAMRPALATLADAMGKLPAGSKRTFKVGEHTVIATTARDQRRLVDIELPGQGSIFSTTLRFTLSERGAKHLTTTTTFRDGVTRHATPYLIEWTVMRKLPDGRTSFERFDQRRRGNGRFGPLEHVSSYTSDIAMHHHSGGAAYRDARYDASLKLDKLPPKAQRIKPRALDRAMRTRWRVRRQRVLGH